MSAAVIASDEFVEQVLRRVQEVKEKADKHLEKKERPTKNEPVKLKKVNGYGRPSGQD